MRIIEEYSKDSIAIINIIKAEYAGDFVITVFFSDGNHKSLDFKPFMRKSRHPSIQKYRNEDLFRKFEITDGNLNWNDYDLIFPIGQLYEGKID